MWETAMLGIMYQFSMNLESVMGTMRAASLRVQQAEPGGGSERGMGTVSWRGGGKEMLHHSDISQVGVYVVLRLCVPPI